MSSRSEESTTPTKPAAPFLVDIGSNLGDGVFHGSHKHPDDFQAVLARARAAGVTTQIITGTSLSESKSALDLLTKDPEGTEGLYATVGCHPTRAQDFEKHSGGAEAYLRKLKELIEKNKFDKDDKKKGKVVAIGEFGLDGDRLMACPMEIQLKYFKMQLDEFAPLDMPLFLHSRAAHKDLVDILRSYEGPKPLRGVVHSHSGTLEEALEYIEMGFYVGINGCSLKTAENLACVSALPLTSLLLESDCPYCEIRPTHASHAHLSTLKVSTSHSHLQELYAPPSVKKERWVEGKAVKGRNEPASTGQVAWVVAQLKGVTLEEVCETTTRNAKQLFGLPG